MTVHEPVRDSVEPRLPEGRVNGKKVRVWASRILPIGVMLLVALYAGCWDAAQSGPLWPDAPQYANAAAMIHDWLRSDSLLDPFGFALRNYAQYPAFHLPYHPPGYPAALALFFTITGVSYLSARVFIALCLWAAAVAFYEILRQMGTTRTGALLTALLLMTMPEVALWSRDTMSEIPGLAFALTATFFFVRWVRGAKYADYVVAFCFAELAFLSRYLTAGILPAWFLWALVAGRRRDLLRARIVFPPAVFLVLNSVYTMWAHKFSRFEVGSYGAPPPNRNYTAPLSWDALSFYGAAVPEMAGWWTLAAAAIGLVYLVRRRSQAAWLWVLWCAAYVLFVLSVGIFDENRYFLYALPGLAALAGATAMRGKVAGTLLLLACLGLNASRLTSFASGLTGYEAVAHRLHQFADPGNVLVGTIHSSDLMFRFRSDSTNVPRQFIRADRTLAIRPPTYTDVPSQVLARRDSDVIDIVRRGRVRYIVLSAGPNETEEMALLRSVISRRPDLFQAAGDFPLRMYLSPPGESYRVSIWRYSGELPPGPSELPVVVPTAGLAWQPNP